MTDRDQRPLSQLTRDELIAIIEKQKSVLLRMDDMLADANGWMRERLAKVRK